MTRKEILKAALADGDEFTGHLAECPQCREYVLMLRAFSASNRIPLPEAPKAWIERAVNLAQKEGIFKQAVRTLAELVFDSWTIPHPIGVRGEAASDNRRLRFESPHLTFDLHAERRGRNWVFVAQAIKAKTGVNAIRIGGKALMPDSSGIFQWSSKKPPQKISLVTGQEVIDLPKLLWKNPQTK